jgi:peroxiredoxin
MAAVAEVEQAPRTGSFPAGLSFVAFAAYRAVRTTGSRARTQRPELAAQALRVLASARGVALRGTYDTSGYRSDARLLVWLAAPSPDLLQDAIAAFAQTPMALGFEAIWTAFGVHRPSEPVHRPSEHGKTGVPAYYRGEGARRYLCVYPLVHTPDWYLLAPQHRKQQVIDELRVMREYPEVRASTLSAFGLGDHEWLYAFESDQLVQLVDLQRQLRSAGLRRYVQVASPVFTGMRKPLGELLEALP